MFWLDATQPHPNLSKGYKVQNNYQMCFFYCCSHVLHKADPLRWENVSFLLTVLETKIKSKPQQQSGCRLL